MLMCWYTTLYYTLLLSFTTVLQVYRNHVWNPSVFRGSVLDAIPNFNVALQRMIEYIKGVN